MRRKGIVKFAQVLLATLLACTPLQLVHAEELAIAAVVNDHMISSLDVDQRIQFALATTGMSDTPEVRAQMRSQIIRTLIDERLQMNEAAQAGIVVTPDELKNAFMNVNKQQQQPPGMFEHFLESRGVPMDTVEEQLKAKIAWSKFVMQKLRRNVKVGEDEVARERERLAQGQDIREYQISSIVLEVPNPENDQEVKALAEKLSAELKAGGNFQALARQFSSGGEGLVEKNQYRWVQLHQLEPILAKNVESMKKDDITKPLRTLSGYHILKMHDQRTSNTAQIFDSEVLLKQITMKLKPNAEFKEAKVLLDIAREVAKYPGSCQQDEVAGMTDLDEMQFDVTFQRVNFRQVQPDLQTMLASLRVGDVSEPYASPDGIHLVMLCERIELPPELPPAERVKEKIFQDKLELEASKQLRDIRREAFVEIR